MDDLLTDFIAETREMMEAIEGEIIAWEAAPSDSSHLDAIFRFIHTVKGNCGFFDLPRLERLSHAAEDALTEVKAGKRQLDGRLVSTILATIDCIGEFINAIEADVALPRGREAPLIAALERDASQGSDVVEELPSKAKVAALAASQRSIRLPVELLDRVMSGVSDMVLARNDLANRLLSAGTQPTIDGPFERLTTILADVRDAITRMRMQRVEQLFNTIPRLVRDLSQELGKQITLEIEGGDVELDREVIEIIRDPIMHIVRNAIDHGIEGPSDRQRAGKSENGILRIAARQAGNRISIVISDDGRGLNEDQIAYKAIAGGLITAATRDKMDNHAIQQLVFEAGLSTAEEVSAISGRGVGMDAARDNLERVGGQIEVSSSPGEGTSFYLHIPLTLSIIPGVIVESAGQRFAIPQSYVEEVEFGFEDSLDFTRMGDANLVTMRGQRTPCLSLANILGATERGDPSDQSYVLLRLARGGLFALSVDRVHNIGDIVVKPLPPALLKIGCYSGTALLDDGQPILLLDLPQIAQSHGLAETQGAGELLAPLDDSKNQASEEQMVMHFVALDGTHRATRLELVKRIETIASSDVHVSDNNPRAVVDGVILPVAGCDNALVSDGKVRLLRLSDGSRELLYAVKKVLDTVVISKPPTPVKGDPLLEGHVLIEGHSVGLIHARTLFETLGQATQASGQTLCSVPDTEWARTILAPLLSSNGYAIAYGSTDADINIALEDSAETSGTQDAPMIALHMTNEARSSREATPSAPFPFERETLLSALRETGQHGKSARGAS